MANNKIQIKRSTTTATPASLSAGELAFSNVTGGSGVLFIGSTDGGTVVPIGGVRNPGTLTANQALVANSTSGIDKIITANLTLSSFSVSTINAVANLTNLGAASNNELTTTWAIKTFVDNKIAQASNPQGSNGQFQYNNSGVLSGTSNFVYDNTNGRITVGNSTVNVQLGYTGDANALAHFHGNQNAYVQVILNNVNSGLSASSDYILENDIGTETVNFLDLGINSSNYNDANFSAMGAGDSYLYAANNDLVIGTADSGGGEVRFITGGTTSGQVRATITLGGNVGIGNTTPNAKLQVTGTANISGNTVISSNLTIGSGLNANGSFGTAGQLLTSNGTVAYWSTPAPSVVGSDTQVQYNDGGTLAGAAGLTFNKTTNNVTIANTLIFGNSTVNSIHTSSILQISNSTSVANLTAIGLSAGANVVANTTTLKVGNTTITTTNAVFGGTIAANGGVGTAGQVLVSGGSTNSYWTNSLGTFQFTDLTVSGNLSVLGDLVSLNVATLSIEDSLITVAKDQASTGTYTDAVDSGFFSVYGNTAQTRYSGLFRDQSDSGIYKLFDGQIPAPTSTVDTTNVNFAFATLQGYLRAGGSGASALIANSSHVNITANSTTNVFITANTLSLTTALPVTSGGIGLNSVAVGDLLVGNSTNTLTRLVSGADGYVLQVNGTGVVTWNTIDGGTF